MPFFACCFKNREVSDLAERLDNKIATLFLRPTLDQQGFKIYAQLITADQRSSVAYSLERLTNLVMALKIATSTPHPIGLTPFIAQGSANEASHDHQLPRDGRLCC